MPNSDKIKFFIKTREGKCQVLFLFLFLVSVGLNPQKILAQGKEMGGGIGAFNYTGDLAPYIDPVNFRPAAQIFYIRNLRKSWAAKFTLTGGRIAGSDQREVDALAGVRDYSFADNLFELSVAAVYHFLDYRGERALVNFSPYFTLGGGMFLMYRNDKVADYSSIQFVVPMGVGIKWNISPYLDLGFEFVARKTFFDYLDNVSREEIVNQASSTYQFGSWNQNDWYYYTGVSLSYIFYEVDCPNPWHKKIKIK